MKLWKLLKKIQLRGRHRHWDTARDGCTSLMKRNFVRISPTFLNQNCTDYHRSSSYFSSDDLYQHVVNPGYCVPINMNLEPQVVILNTRNKKVVRLHPNRFFYVLSSMDMPESLDSTRNTSFRYNLHSSRSNQPMFKSLRE